MSQNAAQWLAEVQSLQRQVRSLQAERDKAYASADNWRKLYESEGQQRRRDAEKHAQKLQSLQGAIQQAQSSTAQTAAISR